MATCWECETTTSQPITVPIGLPTRLVPGALPDIRAS